jgi:hypothetical protein
MPTSVDRRPLSVFSHGLRVTDYESRFFRDE